MQPAIRIIRLWIAMCNLCLSLTRSLLFRGRPSPKPTRVLVVREGYIGDLTVCIPALNHVRKAGESDPTIALLTHPTSTSGGVVNSPAAELLREWRLIDLVIYLPTRLGRPARREIIAFGADRVVFIPYTSTPFKSMMFQLIRLRLIGVTVRPEGFSMRSLSGWLRSLQHEGGMVPHQAVTALGAVGVPATEADRHPMPPVPVLQGASLTAGAALAGVGDRPVIVLGCSAKYWHKRWPAYYYVRVMDAIAAHRDVAWVILGAAQDAEAGAEIVRATKAFAINLCGALRLPETAELIRMSSLYLGNDTGLAHLCAALGIPTVTVFSGIHPPAVWDPWSSRNITLRATVPCQGCGSERFCPSGDKRCLTDIKPESVIEAAELALSERFPPAPLVRGGSVCTDPGRPGHLAAPGAWPVCE